MLSLVSFKVTKSDAESCELQSDIDVLQQWTEIWLLKLNKEKCKHMSIGMAADRHYCIGSGSNRTVEEERNLGICITADLKWKHQC